MSIEFTNSRGQLRVASTFEELCPDCRRRAAASTTTYRPVAPMPSAPQWRAAVGTVPPAPSQIDAIQAHRGTKRPPVAPRALLNGVPVAPSLIDAIKAHRGGR
jgi:hypothetical protein